MTTSTRKAPAETVRAAIYTRISLDKAGDEHGVANQLATAEEAASRRGWEVVARYSDNDISAFTGKHRPGYEEMMAAASRREFDAIIVFQTSRLWRDRGERAAGIKALREAAIAVIAVKGPSLDMSTAYGRGMAGLLGEFDTMESEVKGERQALAAQERAKNGHPPLGVRLTGYTTAGEIISAEAALVRAMFERFHAGDSLRGIVAWLTETGAATRHGRPWNPSSVRTILLNPRYAGRAIYNGAVMEGTAGNWPAIVEGWLFDLVNERLADPRRRSQTGTDRKHLGSGLYLCGVCDSPVVSLGSGGRDRVHTVRYHCAGHITRLSTSIDAYVLDLVRGWLARPELAARLGSAGSAEAQEAADEIQRLTARLAQTEADYDADLIDGTRYKIKSAKLRAELTTARRHRAKLIAGSGAESILGAADPVAAFENAPLGARRAVIGVIMTVRLDPAPRGRKFSHTTVRIGWN